HVETQAHCPATDDRTTLPKPVVDRLPDCFLDAVPLEHRPHVSPRLVIVLGGNRKEIFEEFDCQEAAWHFRESRSITVGSFRFARRQDAWRENILVEHCRRNDIHGRLRVFFKNFVALILDYSGQQLIDADTRFAFVGSEQSADHLYHFGTRLTLTENDDTFHRLPIESFLAHFQGDNHVNLGIVAVQILFALGLSVRAYKVKHTSATGD